VDRVGSYDSKSVKSDKRRSGFFGFGKKDKDKEGGKGDKDKEVCSAFLPVCTQEGSERGEA
jgi:hypothetical protein